MHRLMKLLLAALPYLMALVLTGCVWLGFFSLQDHMLAPCDEVGRCTSFIDYSLHDPFCILDPTCVSPLYNPSWSGYAPHWQGLRWVTDPLLVSGSGLTMLAIPNYLLFMLLATAAVVLVQRIHAPRYRRLALAVIFTWCALEVAGWSRTIVSLDPGQPIASFGTAALLLLSASWLGAAYYIDCRSRHAGTLPV
jgi:hypothetical protein